MTADDFTAWMGSVGWNISQVARGLCLSRNTVAKYMEHGAPDHIAYACAALAAGLPKWQAPS